MKKIKKKIEKDQDNIMKIIKKKDKNVKETDIKTWVSIKKTIKRIQKTMVSKIR